MHRAPHVLLATLLLAACADGGTSTPAPYATYAASVVQAQCAAIFDCCDQTRIAATAADYTDVPSCVQHDSFATAKLSAAYRYDADAAGACLARMKDELAACTLTVLQSNGFGLCPEAFVGTLPEGASCTLEEGAIRFANPCVAGTKCIFDQTRSADFCVKAVAVGESCALSPCLDGLRCGDDLRCFAPQPVGAACNNDNFACDTEACQNGTCVAPPPAYWVCYYDPS